MILQCSLYNFALEAYSGL
uniref:Uncharacterized protein n=1 Tax=Anguilla anguilla TaxID=7936 RepID=A0A0E9SXC8_ANGAN